MAKKTFKSAEDAKNIILNAAQELMVEVGPAGLRISSVAKKAGMAHPNIIHHFGSRQGLLEALAKRVGQRATERVKHAIDCAVQAQPEDRVAAMTEVFDSAYRGDEGRAAIWLHMSGAQSSLKSNMQSIVEMSHQLRETIDPAASRENTSRLVMLISLAMVGEVVSGEGIKDALGFGSDEQSRAHFKQWLAEILLNLSDDQLSTTLDQN